MDLFLTIAGADYRRHYCAAHLDAADRARLARTPQLEQRADWQTSRALKHTLPRHAATYSLSHSQGCAALLWANTACALGVDVQHMRPRPYARLLPLFARSDECAWWRRQPDPRLAYYQLWTLKEAVIKAAGWDFPGDLRRVAFRLPENGADGIAEAAGQKWRALWWAPWQDFLLCAVWPQPHAARLHIVRADTGTAASVPPQRAHGMITANGAESEKY